MPCILAEPQLSNEGAQSCLAAQKISTKMFCMGMQIDAIFRHESQKDRALFPGADEREFWQRAQDRNKVTCPSLVVLSVFENQKKMSH